MAEPARVISRDEALRILRQQSPQRANEQPSAAVSAPSADRPAPIIAATVVPPSDLPAWIQAAIPAPIPAVQSRQPMMAPRRGRMTFQQQMSMRQGTPPWRQSGLRMPRQGLPQSQFQLIKQQQIAQQQRAQQRFAARLRQPVPLARGGNIQHMYRANAARPNMDIIGRPRSSTMTQQPSRLASGRNVPVQTLTLKQAIAMAHQQEIRQSETPEREGAGVGWMGAGVVDDGSTGPEYAEPEYADSEYTELAANDPAADDNDSDGPDNVSGENDELLSDEGNIQQASVPHSVIPKLPPGIRIEPSGPPWPEMEKEGSKSSGCASEEDDSKLLKGRAVTPLNQSTGPGKNLLPEIKTEPPDAAEDGFEASNLQEQSDELDNKGNFQSKSNDNRFSADSDEQSNWSAPAQGQDGIPTNLAWESQPASIKQEPRDEDERPCSATDDTMEHQNQHFSGNEQYNERGEDDDSGSGYEAHTLMQASSSVPDSANQPQPCNLSLHEAIKLCKQTAIPHAEKRQIMPVSPQSKNDGPDKQCLPRTLSLKEAMALTRRQSNETQQPAPDTQEAVVQSRHKQQVPPPPKTISAREAMEWNKQRCANSLAVKVDSRDRIEVHSDHYQGTPHPPTNISVSEAMTFSKQQSVTSFTNLTLREAKLLNVQQKQPSPAHDDYAEAFKYQPPKDSVRDAMALNVQQHGKSLPNPAGVDTMYSDEIELARTQSRTIQNAATLREQTSVPRSLSVQEALKLCKEQEMGGLEEQEPAMQSPVSVNDKGMTKDEEDALLQDDDIITGEKALDADTWDEETEDNALQDDSQNSRPHFHYTGEGGSNSGFMPEPVNSSISKSYSDRDNIPHCTDPVPYQQRAAQRREKGELYGQSKEAMLDNEQVDSSYYNYGLTAENRQMLPLEGESAAQVKLPRGISSTSSLPASQLAPRGSLAAKFRENMRTARPEGKEASEQLVKLPMGIQAFPMPLERPAISKSITNEDQHMPVRTQSVIPKLPPGIRATLVRSEEAIAKLPAGIKATPVMVQGGTSQPPNKLDVEEPDGKDTSLHEGEEHILPEIEDESNVMAEQPPAEDVEEEEEESERESSDDYDENDDDGEMVRSDAEDDFGEDQTYKSEPVEKSSNENPTRPRQLSVKEVLAQLTGSNVQKSIGEEDDDSEQPSSLNQYSCASETSKITELTTTKLPSSIRAIPMPVDESNSAETMEDTFDNDQDVSSAESVQPRKLSLEEAMPMSRKEVSDPQLPSAQTHTLSLKEALALARSGVQPTKPSQSAEVGITPHLSAKLNEPGASVQLSIQEAKVMSGLTASTSASVPALSSKSTTPRDLTAQQAVGMCAGGANMSASGMLSRTNSTEGDAIVERSDTDMNSLSLDQTIDEGGKLYGRKCEDNRDKKYENAFNNAEELMDDDNDIHRGTEMAGDDNREDVDMEGEESTDPAGLAIKKREDIQRQSDMKENFKSDILDNKNLNNPKGMISEKIGHVDVHVNSVESDRASPMDTTNTEILLSKEATSQEETPVYMKGEDRKTVKNNYCQVPLVESEIENESASIKREPVSPIPANIKVKDECKIKEEIKTDAIPSIIDTEVKEECNIKEGRKMKADCFARNYKSEPEDQNVKDEEIEKNEESKPDVNHLKIEVSENETNLVQSRNEQTGNSSVKAMETSESREQKNIPKKSNVSRKRNRESSRFPDAAPESASLDTEYANETDNSFGKEKYTRQDADRENEVSEDSNPVCPSTSGSGDMETNVSGETIAGESLDKINDELSSLITGAVLDADQLIEGEVDGTAEDLSEVKDMLSMLEEKPGLLDGGVEVPDASGTDEYEDDDSASETDSTDLGEQPAGDANDADHEGDDAKEGAPTMRKQKAKRRKKKTRKRKKEAESDESTKKDDDSGPLNKRRNIRQIISEEKLDAETLRAQEEEKDRQQRLQEQKKRYEHFMKEQERLAAEKAEQDAEDERKPVLKEQGDIIVLSSDEEKEKRERSLPASIQITPIIKEEPPAPAVESSDDDIQLLSSDEAQKDEGPPEDTNNSGSHTDDTCNVPDPLGRVLVNVGHPPSEEDVFIAPQIARNIKPHQIGGVRFLYDNLIESQERCKTTPGFGCILAHSMGLGKTMQTVTFTDVFLRHTGHKTVLIIVPINTIQNWLNEFNCWLPEAGAYTPLADGGEVRPRHFPVFIVNDSHRTTHARARVIRDWYKEGGVLLIGYELYRLLSISAARKKKRKDGTEDLEAEARERTLLEGIKEAISKPGPDLVICDEGHRIKNAGASISQALKSIRTRRRLALTGYPLQNCLVEYWCMVDFVRPNFLGTKAEFNNMFERPISNGQCVDSTASDVRLMRFRSHVLHSLLEGLVQRRSDAILQATLPKKEEFVCLLRMTALQRKLYQSYMHDLTAGAASRGQTPNPLRAFVVSCKIWNHPDILFNLVKKKMADEDLDLDENETGVTPTIRTRKPPNGAAGAGAAAAGPAARTAASNLALGDAGLMLPGPAPLPTGVAAPYGPTGALPGSAGSGPTSEGIDPMMNSVSGIADPSMRTEGFGSMPGFGSTLKGSSAMAEGVNSAMGGPGTMPGGLAAMGGGHATMGIDADSMAGGLAAMTVGPGTMAGRPGPMTGESGMAGRAPFSGAGGLRPPMPGSESTTAGVLPGSNQQALDSTPLEKPTPAATLANEANLINYDWAQDLLQNYVPGQLENSTKMMVFGLILEETVKLGDKMLVFSQSLFTLNIIEEFLQRNIVPGTNQHWMLNHTYYRLDGSTTGQEREKLINEFNSSPSVPLFLVSTRAGSLGVNLVGANRVLVFDASWNPCHDTQAVCRVYRFGQQKKCYIYRLVTDNCLERRIYDRQLKKQSMSNRIVDETNPDNMVATASLNRLLDPDEDDPPPGRVSLEPGKFDDQVLVTLVNRLGHLFSQEPFEHDAQLADRTDKRLTQAEKRLAKRSYELEKKAAGAGGRGAAGMYGRGLPMYGRGGMYNKPVANVRPMLMGGRMMPRGGAGAPYGAGRMASDPLTRQGVSMSHITVPKDVTIPTGSGDGEPIHLRAGQTVLVIRTAKGVYLRLQDGRIIAIRMPPGSEGRGGLDMLGGGAGAGSGGGGGSNSARGRYSQMRPQPPQPRAGPSGIRLPRGITMERVPAGRASQPRPPPAYKRAVPVPMAVSGGAGGAATSVSRSAPRSDDGSADSLSISSLLSKDDSQSSTSQQPPQPEDAKAPVSDADAAMKCLDKALAIGTGAMDKKQPEAAMDGDSMGSRDGGDVAADQSGTGRQSVPDPSGVEHYSHMKQLRPPADARCSQQLPAKPPRFQDQQMQQGQQQPSPGHQQIQPQLQMQPPPHHQSPQVQQQQPPYHQQQFQHSVQTNPVPKHQPMHQQQQYPPQRAMYPPDGAPAPQQSHGHARKQQSLGPLQNTYAAYPHQQPYADSPYQPQSRAAAQQRVSAAPSLVPGASTAADHDAFDMRSGSEKGPLQRPDTVAEQLHRQLPRQISVRPVEQESGSLDELQDRQRTAEPQPMNLALAGSQSRLGPPRSSPQSHHPPLQLPVHDSTAPASLSFGAEPRHLPGQIQHYSPSSAAGRPPQSETAYLESHQPHGQPQQQKPQMQRRHAAVHQSSHLSSQPPASQHQMQPPSTSNSADQLMTTGFDMTRGGAFTGGAGVPTSRTSSQHSGVGSPTAVPSFSAMSQLPPSSYSSETYSNATRSAPQPSIAKEVPASMSQNYNPTMGSASRDASLSNSATLEASSRDFSNLGLVRDSGAFSVSNSAPLPPVKKEPGMARMSLDASLPPDASHLHGLPSVESARGAAPAAARGLSHSVDTSGPMLREPAPLSAAAPAPAGPTAPPLCQESYPWDLGRGQYGLVGYPPFTGAAGYSPVGFASPSPAAGYYPGLYGPAAGYAAYGRYPPSYEGFGATPAAPPFSAGFSLPAPQPRYESYLTDPAPDFMLPPMSGPAGDPGYRPPPQQ